MPAGLVALMLAAIFSGAAVYVSFVEQPARLALDDRAALIEWKPSYRRGAAMQALLAVIAFVAGALAWWQTKVPLFALGAIFQILPWPWTLGVMLPTNKALLASPEGGPQTRALMEKWGRLHLMRTGLGLAATAAFLWACLTA